MTQAGSFLPEYISFVFIVIILYLMLSTHPRPTKVYFINFLGVLLSSIEILLHRCIYDYIKHNMYSNALLICCAIYFIIYTVILCVIYIYISLLSYYKRQHMKRMWIFVGLLAAISIITDLILLFNGKMIYQEAGNLVITGWFNAYLFFGILDALFCMITSMINRKAISRRIFGFIVLFCPLDVCLLIFQFMRPAVQFSSLTYIIPFMLFYILFHSNPYDEVSGCQNWHSYIARFYENVYMRKKFMIICVEFPKLKHSHQLYAREKINYMAAIKCREIEAIHPNIFLYALKDYQYALIANINDPAKEDRLIEQVRRIMDTTIFYKQEKFNPVYKMIAFKSSPFINNPTKLASLQRFLFGKMKAELSVNQCYIAQKQDYETFMEAYTIEQLLLKIKSTHDLNDEHVLCYTQPIFNVEHDQFLTAEALMRLQIDGKVICPDKFIPAAEQNNCIHTLTCIILNKVCQKIKELSESYDFEAITVNCSTTELSDPNLYKEILQIIRQNDVDCSKICLELTESAMFNDYNTVLYNMQKLREAGVQFYLDDFGTGYSNLERILSCPFKTIKFDKSLLYKSMEDNAIQELLQSMVNVFKRQGLHLLVEGVENSEQNEYSIERGFQYIQGYMYSKPLPADELTKFFPHK